MIARPSNALLHKWNLILLREGLSTKRGLCQRKLAYVGPGRYVEQIERDAVARQDGCGGGQCGVRTADAAHSTGTDLKFRLSKGYKLPRREYIAKPPERRRYTAWVPERPDKVFKHEQLLAAIAELVMARLFKRRNFQATKPASAHGTPEHRIFTS